ncbi:hypothetical protein Bbelb_316970 [Branchiostoma belcheri]|nr:hypothetical protein Bbelb_316970 [Branchiostoma belcheri]
MYSPKRHLTWSLVRENKLYSPVGHLIWPPVRENKLYSPERHLTWSLVRENKLYSPERHLTWSLVRENKLYSPVRYLNWSPEINCAHLYGTSPGPQSEKINCTHLYGTSSGPQTEKIYCTYLYGTSPGPKSRKITLLTTPGPQSEKIKCTHFRDQVIGQVPYRTRRGAVQVSTVYFLDLGLGEVPCRASVQRAAEGPRKSAMEGISLGSALWKRCLEVSLWAFSVCQWCTGGVPLALGSANRASVSAAEGPKTAPRLCNPVAYPRETRQNELRKDSKDWRLISAPETVIVCMPYVEGRTGRDLQFVSDEPVLRDSPKHTGNLGADTQLVHLGHQWKLAETSDFLASIHKFPRGKSRFSSGGKDEVDALLQRFERFASSNGWREEV